MQFVTRISGYSGTFWLADLIIINTNPKSKRIELQTQYRKIPENSNCPKLWALELELGSSREKNVYAIGSIYTK